MASPFGATMRIPWRTPFASPRSIANIAARDAAGFAVSFAATRSTAPSRRDSVRAMSPRMFSTSRPRCCADFASKSRLICATSNCMVSQVSPASKRKTAAARAAVVLATREMLSRTTLSLLSRRPDRYHRPAVALLLERDVQLARLGFAGILNRPGAGDVVLLLGAALHGLLLFERGRLDLVEETVEQVRGLIAAEEIALLDEAGELQHHLVARRHAGNDRLRVAAAESALQIRHRRVEVAELRGRDQRNEKKQGCELHREFHGDLQWFG